MTRLLLVCCLLFVFVGVTMAQFNLNLMIDEMLLRDYVILTSILRGTRRNTGVRVPPTRCSPSCATNADCYVTPSNRYFCRCRPNYVQNGRSCQAAIRPSPRPGGFCSQCHPQATCFRSNRGLVCRCQDGYQGSGFNCEKVSTLAPTTTPAPSTTPVDMCGGVCGPNAICLAIQGSYSCACQFGYTGNGFTCEKVSTATAPATPTSSCPTPCGSNASCLPDALSAFRCVCNFGFTGDGFSCNAVSPTCNPGCDVNAGCVLEQGNPQCECNEGFYGTGLRCIARSTTCPAPCHSNGVCVRAADLTSQCICDFGFQGDGLNCVARDATPTTPLGVCNNPPCGPNAFCTSENTCQCNDGFIGNGFNCLALNPSTDSTSNCAPKCSDDRTCVKSDERYVCACKSGYEESNGVCVQMVATTTPESSAPCGGKCHKYASCLRNRNGDSQCVCRPGWSGEGQYCFDAYSFQCLRSWGTRCHSSAVCRLVGFNYRCRCPDTGRIVAGGQECL